MGILSAMEWRSPAVDDLESLAKELNRLAAVVDRAEAGEADDALWEAELGLRHVSRRAELRADDLRRVIERRKRAFIAQRRAAETQASNVSPIRRTA